MERHYTDDDLTLYYYGEAGRAERIDRHLAACPVCASRFADLSATLDLIAADVPTRDERYGLEVWQRIRHELPAQDAVPWYAWRTARRVGLLAAAAALTVAVVGVERTHSPSRLRTPLRTDPAALGQPFGAVDRARFAAIGDHLERSERVLLDLANGAADPAEIGDEQAWARDLIAANRLYRESATQAGEAEIALVLDDLERGLLDIVHEPTTMTSTQLDELRGRLDGAALLFKLRVLADDLHEREQAPAPGATT
jgi:hypothetical protein